MRFTAVRFLTVSVLAYSFAGTELFADGRRDFYSQLAQQRYYDQPQNARTFGMGGSSVVTSSDSSSTVGNPAGLGMMKDGEASVTYGRNTVSGNEHPSYGDSEQTEDSGQALMALPLGPTSDGLPWYGNIGLGWSGYDSDVDDSINTKTDGYRVNLAYGKALSETFSIGYGLTYVNDTIEADNFDFSGDNKFRHTLGIQNKASDTLTLGAIAFIGHGDQDMRVLSTGQTESSDMNEFGFELGAGMQVATGTLVSFAAGYSDYDADGSLVGGPDTAVFGGDEKGHTFNIRLGMEQAVSDSLKLRAGYRYAGVTEYDFERADLESIRGSAKYNAFSAGVGTMIDIDGTYVQAIKLDYGVEYRALADGDWQHVVTASVPFTICDPVS